MTKSWIYTNNDGVTRVSVAATSLVFALTIFRFCARPAGSSCEPIKPSIAGTREERGKTERTQLTVRTEWQQTCRFIEGTGMKKKPQLNLIFTFFFFYTVIVYYSRYWHEKQIWIWPTRLRLWWRVKWRERAEETAGAKHERSFLWCWRMKCAYNVGGAISLFHRILNRLKLAPKTPSVVGRVDRKLIYGRMLSVVRLVGTVGNSIYT